MKYVVNDRMIEYHSEGTFARGRDVVLLKNAVDLTADTGWHDHGFTTAGLLKSREFREFNDLLSSLIRNCWRRASLEFPTNLPLDQYHTVANDPTLHQAAIQQTKLLPSSVFPFGITWLEERVSEICKHRLVAKNPFDDQSIFHFRVIRPSQNDYNPLHRDVWLEDYDDCINLYIPICGSDENSSLILIPGSHLWPESRIKKTTDGAVINGVKFNVPAITQIFGEYYVTRPNPRLNEVLIFSPYLIHGGAVNLNADKTRISIELRLWKKS
jgi:hypothetical protein